MPTYFVSASGGHFGASKSTCVKICLACYNNGKIKILTRATNGPLLRSNAGHNPTKLENMILSLRIHQTPVIAMLAWAVAFATSLALPALGAPKIGDEVATLIPVEFPLTAATEGRLIETLERLANRTIAENRPIVVLEFIAKQGSEVDGKEQTIGRGTEFVRALALARWLSGTQGSRIRSVAFIPSTICGHAVLVALSCEEIAIAPLAEIGRAGIDEPILDGTIRQSYLDIAARRGAFPPASVLSLIDPSEALYELTLADKKTDFTTTSDLPKKIESGLAKSWEQKTIANQMARFTGQELRTWRWVAHNVNDREQLARVLKLSKPISEKPTFAGPRVMTRVHLKGIVSKRQITRTIRAIEEGLGKTGTNLVLVEIDSPGGKLNESMRLARYLAEIPNEQAEVVSYITGAALGDVALIALASDLILMQPDAKMGGTGEATISPAVCNAQKLEIQELAKLVGRSDGELLGCICPEFEIFEYHSFDGQSQLNSPEWLVDDPVAPMWNKGVRVNFVGGLSFAQASELGLAADNPISLEAVGNKFGIDTVPPETRTNATEQFVEWLGGQGWLSMLLFMVGIVSLSAELSTPGIGIAGILSAVCFLLFFWIHLFQGTVEWLEILLILAGVVCLAAELFVLPGFGVFGVTGLTLLAVGLLLAGQTFVIPTNDYQWRRTAQSIGQMGLIVMGTVGLAIVFRKQLANLPMVRWFALQPPKTDRDLVEMEHVVEELRTFVGWNGTTVSRCNPSGKASIGDRIFSVVSQGNWIDEDTEIKVISVQGNTLIVKSK